MTERNNSKWDGGGDCMQSIPFCLSMIRLERARWKKEKAWKNIFIQRFLTLYISGLLLFKLSREIDLIEKEKARVSDGKILSENKTNECIDLAVKLFLVLKHESLDREPK